MIDFLTNCGNKNLQYLLVPSRLEAALAQLDSDRDGEIDCNEWEDAIETALRNKLAQRAKAREAQAKAAAKEIAKFTSEFLNAARQCFIMSARGARHSTSNLRASRRRRGSYAVDASRRPPPGSRAGSTKTTPGRSTARRSSRPASFLARPFRLHRAAKAPSGWRRVDGAAFVTRRHAATFDLRTGQVGPR